MITQRLQAGDVLVLDGAIGTELEKRGIPEVHDASWGECLETYPETVLEVHRDYVRAGADIITTNTYSSGAGAMQRIGQSQNVAAWNIRAVELAKQACDEAEDKRTIYVGGSISAFGNGAMRYQGMADSIDWGERDLECLKANFQTQASILVEAGVDFLLLELLGAGRDDIQLAVNTISEFDIPICLALSAIPCTKQDALCLQVVDGVQGAANDTLLGEVVSGLNAQNLTAILSHHLEINDAPQALATIRSNWQGAMGIYPNRTGIWTGKKWIFEEAVTPQHYCDLAQQWIAAGAQIVGGCCGIGPDHIAAVRKVVDGA